jgi:ABC-type antimicrobial peptide transport system permease subunit
MFRHLLKTAFKNILRYKVYTALNILGLSVGMACAILILLWVQHELGFDRFHENSRQIFRVNLKENLHDGIHQHPWTPFPLAKALEDHYPEIMASTRIRRDHFMVSRGEKTFYENNFFFVDPAFFRMFSFPQVFPGNPSRLLSDPGSIVISGEMAEKYFGAGENPVGQILNLDNKRDFMVSGVVRIPDNTEFKADFFLSFQAYDLFNISLADLTANWKGKNYHAYVLVGEGVSVLRLENKISGFLKEYNPEKDQKITLQKLSRVHLFKADGSSNGIHYVTIFSIIALFILLIACVNFMNLSTARSEKRSREVGLRKTIGAGRGELIIQFLSESIMLSGFSFLLSLVIVEGFMPVFRQLSGKQLGLDYSNIHILLGLCGVVLLTGLLSGSYPALYLSSFSPVKILKGTYSSARRGSLFRNSLVIFQFTLSVTLFICTVVVYSQMKYIQNKNLGLDKENLVYVLMEGESKYKYKTLKMELLKNPHVRSASACNILPSEIYIWAGYLDWEGRRPDQKVYFNYSFVDFDYIPTFKMEIKQGRNFSRDFPSDQNNFIINQEAARQMGLASPVGKQLDFWGHKGEIIGVVKDFNFQHLGNKIAPLVLSTGTFGDSKRYLVARIRPGELPETISHFKTVWSRVNPGFAFEYHFFDERYERLYRNEKRLEQILFYFAVLAIFISCLGLFGLASFMAERRTKEIGIRKTLGATVTGITVMLSKKFTGMVVMANLVGWPVAYLAMKNWLGSFAYKTGIGPGLFLLSGITTLLIAWLTVSFQSVRAALTNPTEALRND